MKPVKPPPPLEANEEISALIETLHSTWQRLEELTGGEVDGVTDHNGRTFVLPHVQEQLRHNDALRQATILNALPAHIALLDSQGRIVSVNQAWQQFVDAHAPQSTGYEIGANYLDACDSMQGEYAATAQHAAAGIRAVQNGATIHFSMEYPFHSPTRQRWFLLTASPLGEELPNGVVVMRLDITERKQAEQESRESERRFSDLLGNIELAAVIFDTEARITYCNEFMLRRIGWRSEEVMGRNLFDIFIPPELQNMRGDFIPSLLTNHPDTWHHENEILTRSGERRLIRWSNLVLHTRNGAVSGVAAIGEDITERKRAERELRDSELASMASKIETSAVRDIAARLQAILDTVVDGVITIDEFGKVETFNPASERIFGYTEDEVVGRNIKMLMPEPYQSEHDAYLARYRSTGEARIIGTGREVMGLRKDGSTFPLDLSMSEMTLGGRRHYTGVVRDITERKAAEREVAAARTEAERANTAKNTFLANMSHEIRTPMNGVIGMIEVLQQSSLSGPQMEMANIIRDSSFALLDVINDILDFSKIEADKLEIDHIPMRVADVVEKVGEILSRMALKRNVELTLFTDPAIPERVMGDPGRLRQILLNLTNNAIKFSSATPRPGRVSVRALLVDGDRLELQIADNGIGLDADSLARIFSPFVQADISTTRKYGGTGLGLVISRQLAKMMGGDIRVKSEPGVGSLFSVSLPIELAPKVTDQTDAVVMAADVAKAPEQEVPDVAKAHPAPLPGAAVRQRDGRILVAEDNEINQSVILHQLALLGYVADLADDGQEALARWQQGNHALLLTDLQMPNMDGYELTTAIRHAESNGQHLPIVALTANALKSEEIRCKAAGMDDYLTKPVLLDRLQAMLDKWLPHPDQSEVADDSVKVLPASKLFAVLDRAILPQQIGNDPALIAKFFKDYQLSAQTTADEIRAALALGNWKAAGDGAHKLKSSSRAVGALALGEVCDQLEQAGKEGNADAARVLAAEFESALAAALDHMNHARNLIVVPPSVLLVDDEVFQLQLLSRQLAILGQEQVHACSSGQQALILLETQPVGEQLIFLDLNMPDMDGVEFIRRLVDLPYSGALVLVSGEDARILETAERLARAHHLNVLGHLNKPVQSEHLKTLLERWRRATPAAADKVVKRYSAEDVRRAIAGGELVNYYQPKVNVVSGDFSGVETLVRWQHPADGLVFPDEFIGVAEDNGLIDDLTRVVLVEALEQSRRWRDEGLLLRVAVNVSMHNLARLDFADFVLAEVVRCGVAPESLILEVTESRLMTNILTPLDILTRLRLKRIGLSIDDFGTGNSSLSQLRDIPFDELKIDQSFVHGADKDKTRHAIFTASLAMARQLGMKSVAEGVEDRADWNFLRQQGCDLAQGYFIARPMPAGALHGWLAEWEARHPELIPA